MLFFFRQYPDVKPPVYATQESACFDLHSYLVPYSRVKYYTEDNVEAVADLKYGEFRLDPGHRALIPTGLIFSIPVGYSIRLHPRSGTSLKHGLTLVNCEGVVDADYVEPVFIAVYNLSKVPFLIRNSERLAQGELVKDVRSGLEEIKKQPTRRSDRSGGFGSTGSTGIC